MMCDKDPNANTCLSRDCLCWSAPPPPPPPPWQASSWSPPRRRPSTPRRNCTYYSSMTLETRWSVTDSNFVLKPHHLAHLEESLLVQLLLLPKDDQLIFLPGVADLWVGALVASGSRLAVDWAGGGHAGGPRPSSSSSSSYLLFWSSPPAHFRQIQDIRFAAQDIKRPRSWSVWKTFGLSTWLKSFKFWRTKTGEGIWLLK